MQNFRVYGHVRIEPPVEASKDALGAGHRIRRMLSAVAAALCGISTTFGAASSGFAGSTGNLSSPAAPTCVRGQTR